MKLIPLIILLLVILGCGSRRVEQGRPVATKTTPTATLSAEVSLSDAGVTVKNTDTSDFGPLTLKINLNENGGDDGRAFAGTLPQGKSVTVPYGEFTVGTARFSSAKTKILTIFVKSDDGASKLFLCPGRRCVPA